MKKITEVDTSQVVVESAKVLVTQQETINGEDVEVLRRVPINVIQPVIEFPVAVKAALLACFENVAWINENGQDRYDELYAALYSHPVSIAVTFNQGSNVVYNSDALDFLKQYLTVTATYENGAVKNVTGYTLTGSLTIGTSTITVSYGGKTATFEVVVSEAPLLPREYQQVEWVSANIQDYNLTAYIDTGFVPTVNSYMKARLAAEGVSEGRAYLGVRDASSGSDKAFCIMEYSSAGKIGYMRWGASVQCINKDTDFHVYELSPTVSKIDDVSYTMSAPVSTQTISKAIRMFAWWTGGSWSSSNSVRISYLELGNNGVPSHRFIACYRKADNVIGFYDVVTEQFKTNEGTGSFTKGADVE